MNILLLCCLLFVLHYCSALQRSDAFKTVKASKTSFLATLDPTTSSLIAGSIAGAIGVGVSYPLDSIKTKSQAYASSQGRSPGMVETISRVLSDEGIKGFYQGVAGVMCGQAFIKAVAFWANAFAIETLHRLSISAVPPNGGAPFLSTLILAGCFSGFITSFICNPVERIKVLMQAGTMAPSYSHYSVYHCVMMMMIIIMMMLMLMIL
jgi:hypothetical protein